MSIFACIRSFRSSTASFVSTTRSRKAAIDGQGALALTDSANMFGAVRFYLASRKRGIKPIIGCDLWITNDLDRDNPTRMVVLVQNRRGLFESVQADHARLS